MLTRFGRRLLGPTAALLLSAGLGFGQGAPVPVLPPDPPPPPPPALAYPDITAGPSVSPATGVPSFGDQYLPPPGWFANVDLAVVAPNFRNKLKGVVTLPGNVPSLVEVPAADLDWTFQPKVEIGYRFPLDLGSVILGYRTIVSQGTEDDADNLGNFGTIKSRLNLNQADLDYRSMDFDVGGKLNLFWRLGARFASVYYDSRLDSHLVTTLSGPGEYGARVSNNFIGAGPKAAIEMAHAFTPQFAAYANFDGAVLIGHVDQSYEETFDFPALGGPFGGAADASATQAVPTLAVQAGFRWTPLGPDQVRISLGYQYEYWWMLGRLGGANASSGELESQGVYFRSEFRF